MHLRRVAILAQFQGSILAGIDEKKILYLFRKHMPGVMQSYTKDGHTWESMWGAYIVDRKKFKRWVLRNAMKFVMSARKLNREMTACNLEETRLRDYIYGNFREGKI
jgi:hypothetical protein